MPESKYPKQQDGNTEKHAHSRRRRDIHQKNKLNEFRFKEINTNKLKNSRLQILLQDGNNSFKASLSQIKTVQKRPI